MISLPNNLNANRQSLRILGAVNLPIVLLQIVLGLVLALELGGTRASHELGRWHRHSRILQQVPDGCVAPVACSAVRTSHARVYRCQYDVDVVLVPVVAVGLAVGVTRFLEALWRRGHRCSALLALVDDPFRQGQYGLASLFADGADIGTAVFKVVCRNDFPSLGVIHGRKHGDLDVDGLSQLVGNLLQDGSHRGQGRHYAVVEQDADLERASLVQLATHGGREDAAGDEGDVFDPGEGGRVGLAEELNVTKRASKGAKSTGDGVVARSWDGDANTTEATRRWYKAVELWFD